MRYHSFVCDSTGPKTDNAKKENNGESLRNRYRLVVSSVQVLKPVYECLLKRERDIEREKGGRTCLVGITNPSSLTRVLS